MKPHLTFAHRYWKEIVHPGDTVIDATAGNGHDTLFLASLLQGKGRVVSYDIQPQALEQTGKRLEGLSYEQKESVTLKLQSHVLFEEVQVKLIVYNLGYLPGGDKTVTTQRDSTVESLHKALEILAFDGAISITCYPGHEEGAREQSAIVSFLNELPSARWLICHHQWINRPLSPSLIWLQAVPHA